jgi:hypothetical protein
VLIALEAFHMNRRRRIGIHFVTAISDARRLGLEEGGRGDAGKAPLLFTTAAS